MKVVITYRDEGKQYYDLIRKAFSSAIRLDYEPVLITDDFVKRPDLPLMDWILTAQKAFIDSPLFNEHSIFFSPDAVFQKSVNSVFSKDFDIAVTVRSNKRWPINNGVIFLKSYRRHLISKFWGDCIIRCSEYPQHIRDWYGDQQSLQEELNVQGDVPYELKVLRLPCSEYNANPGSPHAYIAHYKGKRKDEMRCLSLE